MIHRVLLANICILGAAVAQSDEARLYDLGLQQIASGQYERARLSLQTLINAYPRTPLRDLARDAIRTSWIRQGVADPDPMLLFQEGQTRAAAGKREPALLAYQTVINLYPKTEYAARAAAAMKTLQSER